MTLPFVVSCVLCWGVGMDYPMTFDPTDELLARLLTGCVGFVLTPSTGYNDINVRQ